MRPAKDLLDLPYSFTQLPLLMPEEFIREARQRGVRLSDNQLAALHRVRLVTPLFRVQRDGRAISSLIRRGEESVAWQVAHWQPTGRRDLLEARDRGRLFEPAREGFVSRQRLLRTTGGLEYRASEYLYSQHQLLLLPTVRAALPYLRYGRAGDGRGVALEGDRFWGDLWRTAARQLNDTVVALSALEPVYYSRVTGTLSLETVEEFERFDRWRSRLPLQAMLKWLQVDAQWIKATAGGLLHSADGFDPLGDWLAVVREAEPRQWKGLKGEARNAIDFRAAAELLLRYYEALAKGRRAAPLPEPADRWPGDFDGRLKPRRDVDRVLTDYGLSPHPSLVLVVEGETELQIFPRLIEMFGVRTDPNFIAIENAEGVSRDLSPLMAYAIAPRTEADDSGRYLRLARPLTRVLFVTDAEGRMATARDREKRRRVWRERILRTLPVEQRTEAVNEALDRLVYVETWNRRGLSFEFAHFTDRQLAQALDRLDERQRRPTLVRRIRLVEECRARRGNIGELMGWTSKLALADDLWPLLEQKIRLAQRRKTEGGIPIVRVLDRATDLARELPRRNVVIPLQRAK